MTTPSIIASDLSKSFKTGNVTINVLSNLSIDALAGEMTLIVGPSGCGKSTLLALLSGLNKPDNGKITVLGNSLNNMNSEQLDSFRLHNSGFVFQGFNLFPALTALEQVILPLQYLKISAKEAKARAESVIDSVGLTERSHLRPSELSGGEKQRVAIARVLAKKPKIIFADEPTSALDKVSGQRAIDILQKNSKRRRHNCFARQS